MDAKNCDINYYIELLQECNRNMKNIDVLKNVVLFAKVTAVIDLCESIGRGQSQPGIDIKLPQKEKGS